MEYNSKKWRGTAALLVLAFVLYYAANNLELVLSLLGKVWGFSFPLVMGGIMAFVLNIPMSFIERKLWPNTNNPKLQALRRPISLLGAFVFIFAVLSAVVALVLPELMDAIQLLMKEIPKFLVWLEQWVTDNADMFPSLQTWLEGLTINWQEVGKNIFNAVSTGAVGVVDGTVSAVMGIFNGTINLMVSLIFSIYILFGKEKLSMQICATLRAFLPEKTYRVILHVCQVAYNSFSNYVAGQCTEAVILGCLCALGMTLLRMPYAPMVGAMVGVTALIPVVGAFIGASVGIFMILMVNFWQAVGFVVFLIILQQVEGNLIYPRVVGASVGLPALWVLAAVTIGGGLGGIMGMLFSVPTASTCYILLKESVQKRNQVKLGKIQPVEQNVPLPKPSKKEQ